MRCDGNDPCAKCLSTDSACQYSAPASSSSVPSDTLSARTPTEAYSFQATGDFNAPLLVPTTANVAGEFASQYPGLHLEASSTGPSNCETVDLDSLDNDDRNVPRLGLSRPAASTLDSMSCDVLAMPISPDDDFLQFFSAEGMRGQWQTTPVV
ncbi:uncharacterized protein A1O5_00405 [Cladophialophora psammophila CBS 110553]|uniref:Zn(2)-C6 fungal-type domain-containing protein n=1 Tax=Cladophialophora psammophila CBS 110553 TaxID=1182543 RepID=W9X611_9EURO|nr:uncharacterized protein A1O5_00405 [Cladophialophora psammophila CBS 110553]EXJ75897.1 hypothetical protein A1O5_00405 [Cladophialophora psammophila CBS 110553]